MTSADRRSDQQPRGEAEMKTHERRLPVIRKTKAALVLGATVSSLGAASWGAPEPFKVTNIHFETNASACDMGIQLIFDTEGIIEGSVRSPGGGKIYAFESKAGLKKIGGQTEGFLEGVEPQITELLSALGCDRSDEEDEISIDELFKAFPAGPYTFKGTGKDGVKFEGQATLSHAIPAGAEITAPADGTVVPDNAPLLIDWEEVSEPVLADLGPVDVVGYHVVVVEGGGEALPQFDVDVPTTETSVTVPAEYLKPNTFYDFEVLSTDASGNQTISEGFFCTAGFVPCVEP
jgi:hypothetical protein